jgi:membrane fusion protein, multidrug efflux system
MPHDKSKDSASHPLLRAVLLWGVPILLLAAAGGYYFSQRGYESTDNAYVQANMTVVSADVSGRVERVLVHENTLVTRGQPLLELDAEPLRLAAAEARAKLEAAKQDVASLKAQYAEKTTELEVAKRDTSFAQREYAREQELAAKHLVALSKLDDAERALQTATGHLSVLERDLLTLAARLGGDPSSSPSSHPDVRAAQAALERAQLDVQRSSVVAPRDGIVSRLPQVGDHLDAGHPALAIVSDRDVWIEANFKETDLARLHPGQAVEVRIDTYGDRRWPGHITSIAQATGAEFAILPAQNATGNWVKIVQRIPVRIAVDQQPGDPPLRAGMSAYVRVNTRAEAGPAPPAALADR